MSESPDRPLRLLPSKSHRVEESRVVYSSTLSLPVEPELWARLLVAARAKQSSLEALAVRLLDRGLDQEAGRSRAEAALSLLTPREREVVHLTTLGKTNRQIADRLFISQETVKTHVRNALVKFGVRSKSELRLLLQELGSPTMNGEG